jgi:hypothetical protein
VKAAILAIVVLFFTVDLTAQVIFRNDFIIRERKLENRGISSISINLGRFPNWNQLINGRGGRTMVIDLRQITQRKVEYSYSELAEKIYVPAMFTGPVTQKVPMFLLMAPPNAPYPAATFRGLNMKLIPNFKQRSVL